MGRDRIGEWLYTMDEAFEGNGTHSLLANLESLRDDDWLWVPPDGGRSIFDIIRHIGEAKYVYENHTFGDRSMRWDRPGTVPALEAGADKTTITEYLRTAQARLRESVAGLADDAELTQQRPANWGEMFEMRWLINVMVQHDLYHGGEINHIRALHHGNDRWAWE